MARNSYSDDVKKTQITVRNYLTLSAIAAAIVGAIVWGAIRDEAGNHDWAAVALWAGTTFIVVLVGIATLTLAVKDEQPDPDKPRLK